MLEPLVAFTAEDWTAIGGMVVAVVAIGEVTRRGYHWIIAKIEERGATRERAKQTEKEERERNAKLLAAATLINAMDGKLTAQTNSLNDTFNTKFGALEKKFDDHEIKDQERQTEVKGEIAGLRIEVRNGNGHSGET